jgi:predicted  nucleic acid-binding Zn-ribbon protein
MSEEKKEVVKPSADHLEQSLKRLRKRMTYIQDEMDITAFAIRAIEHDLAEIEQEDKVANESVKENA